MATVSSFDLSAVSYMALGLPKQQYSQGFRSNTTLNSARLSQLHQRTQLSVTGGGKLQVTVDDPGFFISLAPQQISQAQWSERSSNSLMFALQNRQDIYPMQQCSLTN